MTTNIRHFLEKRMDELAPPYHETHDAKIKAEIEKANPTHCYIRVRAEF